MKQFPIAMLRIEQIRKDPNNVFRHADPQMQRLVGVIGEHGNLSVICVDAESARDEDMDIDGQMLRLPSYELVGGEARVEAYRAVGAVEVPAILASFESREARNAAAIALNGSFGDFDTQALTEMLHDLALAEYDLDYTGLEPFVYQELLAPVGSEGADLNGDPDEVPEPPAVAITAIGDVIRLGRHILMCGDSTKAAHVQTLLSGSQVDMVWTDPPYGVAYVGKTDEALTIDNDDLDEDALRELLRASLGFAADACRAGGSWYVAAPAGPLFLPFAEVLTDLGIWRQTLVWAKDSFVMGRSDYHYRHEAIFYGWKPGGPHYFIDDRTLDTLIEVARPKASREHPTMKPVELIERAINNSSKRGDLVYDPFGGSGSTLLAAHHMGRRAALMEIDPIYCDVIVARFEKITGMTAIRPAMTAV